MKGASEIGVREPGNRNQRHRHGGGNRQHRAERRDAGRSPIQKKHRDEADITAGQEARRVEQELPVEEKGERTAETLRAEGIAEIDVGSARSRIARRELRPHQPVAERDDRAGDPSHERERAAERGDDQRDRHQRTDPDHRDHVDRDRTTQIDRALHKRPRFGARGGTSSYDERKMLCKIALSRGFLVWPAPSASISSRARRWRTIRSKIPRRGPLPCISRRATTPKARAGIPHSTSCTATPETSRRSFRRAPGRPTSLNGPTG